MVGCTDLLPCSNMLKTRRVENNVGNSTFNVAPMQKMDLNRLSVLNANARKHRRKLEFKITSFVRLNLSLFPLLTSTKAFLLLIWGISRKVLVQRVFIISSPCLFSNFLFGWEAAERSGWMPGLSSGPSVFHSPGRLVQIRIRCEVLIKATQFEGPESLMLAR